jgi:uncharacterized RmlC-like cupin family protein
LKGIIEATRHAWYGKGSFKSTRAGDFMYLACRVPHLLRATDVAVWLVSIVVRKWSAWGGGNIDK